MTTSLSRGPQAPDQPVGAVAPRLPHLEEHRTPPPPARAAAERSARRVPPTVRDRVALAALLVGTAVLYLWNLTASGWANAFYSAAVQAGAESWTAFFYGASDAAASITVDKPPAALWVMALSVRVFGLSSASILVPQAIMGVGSVWLVYAAVRRHAGPRGGLLAGAVLALTPVAALMFRFNNPDALLVLLMVAAAYATLRAVEHARPRWLVLAGVLVGLGFLTKQLQAFLVLPGFVLAYAVAAPTTLLRRARDLLVALAAMIVAGGWWVAVVELVPASARPYIGGSQTNSFLELTFGYNGLGRITGDEVGSVGGGGQAGGWGETGLLRLVNAEIGGQIAWLVPAALVLGVAALWLRRRAPRTDATRAAVIVWGSWLVVTAVVFSLMAGIFHAYYTVALAPAIAALVGIGAVALWRARGAWWATALLAATTLGSAWWAGVLLGRSADFVPWLRGAVVAVGLVAAGMLVAGRALRTNRRSLWRAGAALAVVAGLAGPTAYTVQTVSTAHTGSIVTAGPTVAAAMGGPGGGPGRGGALTGQGPGQGQALGPGGQAAGGQAPGGQALGGQTPGGQVPGGQGGGLGGLLGATTPSDELVAVLLEDADQYTWVAATVGANNAAGYQLATQEPVMPIGGFNGSDPSPTLEQFQQHVADGDIHYLIAGGSGRQGMGGSGSAQEIVAWVEATYPATTVDGVTLYDLSSVSAS